MKRECGTREHQGCCSSVPLDPVESPQFWVFLDSSVFKSSMITSYLYNRNIVECFRVVIIIKWFDLNSFLPAHQTQISFPLGQDTFLMRFVWVSLINALPSLYISLCQNINTCHPIKILCLLLCLLRHETERSQGTEGILPLTLVLSRITPGIKWVNKSMNLS